MLKSGRLTEVVYDHRIEGHVWDAAEVIETRVCLLQTNVGDMRMSWLFISGGQSIGVSASASVLPMNIQD